ncbi:MAG: methenyltetrahydromethanopterin cyclohydrolase [Planctomycetales bacterium]|nr:methenyltetrahydromethanopterin cyclohydrolase [Planctomycetales bacterium]
MSTTIFRLNHRASAVAAAMTADPDGIKIAARVDELGATIVDCGVAARGGLAAGLQLARVCLAGLGEVRLQSGGLTGARVVVSTDQPVAACMGSQYAGWQIAPAAANGYFAMGSGPMRAAAGKEPLIAEIGCAESPDQVVGVLESGKLPPAAVTEYIASACGVPADQVTLLVAPTASLAGAIQVVARSVETALHKLHELGFDLTQIQSGFGAAPLPPVAKDDLQGIGWTNDAVLYGAEVTLWVDADDDAIAEIGPRIPSCASPDYGSPFGEIFRRYNGDFYKIDPNLFSPALIHIQNLRSSRRQTFGQRDEALLRQSFGL